MIKGVADIVFVLDTSSSMNPIFDYLADNIDKFVDKLKADVQAAGQWDLRVGIVAGDAGSVFILPFTKSTLSFKQQISNIKAKRTGYNEVMPWLIDISLVDVEWRTDARRIMIVLTDEPLTGNHAEWFLRDGLKQLIEKLTKFKSLLYFISPSCPDYKTFGVIPRSHIYFIQDQRELEQIEKLDYIFTQINQSISNSLNQQQQQLALPSKFDEYIYKWNYAKDDKIDPKIFKNKS